MKTSRLTTRRALALSIVVVTVASLGPKAHSQEEAAPEIPADLLSDERRLDIILRQLPAVLADDQQTNELRLGESGTTQLAEIARSHFSSLKLLHMRFESEQLQAIEDPSVDPNRMIAELRTSLMELQAASRAQLNEVLDDAQAERLAQLAIQHELASRASSTEGFSIPLMLAGELTLTAQEHVELSRAIEEASEEFNRTVEEARLEARAKILMSMSPKNRDRLRDIIGDW